MHCVYTQAVAFVSKGLKTLWTYIRFSERLQIDRQRLNRTLDQALLELNDLDSINFQHDCSDTHLFLQRKRVSRNFLREVFQSRQRFKSRLLKILPYLLFVFFNSCLQDRTSQKPNRYKKSLLVPNVGNAIGTQVSRVFLRSFTALITDTRFCVSQTS